MEREYEFQYSPSISFPGITRENFWYFLVLKQRGRFPWTEEEIKTQFPSIRRHIEFQSNWNEEQLTTVAITVLNYINKYSCSTSIHTRIFSTATEEDDQPERSSTPAPLRTCSNCDAHLIDLDKTQLCSDCDAIFNR